MVDSDETDDKIIAIPYNDPTWNFYKDITELPPHVSCEIAHFFEVYKQLEHKSTTTSEVHGFEDAKKVILYSMCRYDEIMKPIRPRL